MDAVRFTQQAILPIDGALSEVFPLFGPVRESEWLPTWQPQVVYSRTPFADHAGAIFLSGGHDDMPDTVWYVRTFDLEARLIEYLRVTPGYWLAELTIRFDAISGTRTDVDFRYDFTVLGPQGEASMHLVSDMLDRHKDHWVTSINALLRSEAITG
jgi:hypothetical protein